MQISIKDLDCRLILEKMRGLSEKMTRIYFHKGLFF
jgi:hypothetical protein